jgi:lycopene cyclase domain-containing protein
MSTYFQVLIFSLIVPLIFSFHNKIKFNNNWPSFFKANFLVTIPFLIWDELFTRDRVWGFSHEHITGSYLFNLPIEEILFFIIIPYCCVFTHEVFLKIKFRSSQVVHLLTLLLGIIIFLTGIIFYYKIYTSVTFISLGILLTILSSQKKEFVNTFFLTYVVITVTFFILVNGILTGGITDSPPVWYNNAETLNIRIWTIPIEDFFYSMLLLLSNIWLFETFKSKSNINIK